MKSQLNEVFYDFFVEGACFLELALVDFYQFICLAQFDWLTTIYGNIIVLSDNSVKKILCPIQVRGL
jgi:hypothetical protein